MEGRLVELLTEGDKRTVKGVDEAVQLVIRQPDLINVLLMFMRDDSESTAMRAADCLEKYSRTHASHLQDYEDILLKILEVVPQKEVRWHLAQILPRLELSSASMTRAAKVWLYDYYHSTSSIVRTASLQAVFDIRNRKPGLLPYVKEAVEYGLDHGSAAVKARAKMLYTRLQR